MQGTELVTKSTVFFANGGFNISAKNSYPASAGTSVLVCGQGTLSYYCNSFKGGLLCVRNRRSAAVD